MQSPFLTRRREVVAQKEHQATHLLDVRLCAFERTDHRAVFLTTQVVCNIAEPPEQLMV
jgi:hypothetical protein